MVSNVKIVQSDNFDRENISEQLLAENVPEYWADKIVELLNDKYSGSTTSFYCSAKKDNYKLYIFEI